MPKITQIKIEQTSPGTWRMSYDIPHPSGGYVTRHVMSRLSEKYMLDKLKELMKRMEEE